MKQLTSERRSAFLERDYKLHVFGFLNINKPAGITSRAAVNRLQRLARPAKVGHAGTLDPLATGVLVMAVGPATRLVKYVHEMPKTYRASFRFGFTSTTEDVDGELTRLLNPPRPSREELETACRAFRGETLQRPPAFSALKVAGQRAYDLARSNKPVALSARPVVVHQIEVISFEYPEVKLEVECGSGTYIRSLGRDIAELLGTGAVMSGLTRTGVGSFRIGESLCADSIDPKNWQDWLIPPANALRTMPSVAVSDSDAVELWHGRCIDGNGKRELIAPEGTLALDESGALVAIVRHARGKLYPDRTFPPA